MAVPDLHNRLEEEGMMEGLLEALDVDDDPLHPLTDAAVNGDVEALRLALDNYGGSIDDPVEDGDTALHLSCLFGHLPCVQLLLERGATLDSKDEEGGLPLHDACAGGYTEIVRLIINSAGNPEFVKRMLNTVDSDGDTPLHHAARGEHLGVVILLLLWGASLEKINISGKTPLDLAEHGSGEIRSILTVPENADHIPL